MRSRYSAYVLGLTEYVRSSWHPSTRPGDLTLHPECKWLGLQIKNHESRGATSARVEFVARYRQGGQGAVRLHEISHFVRENGHWFYVRGTPR